MALVGVWNRVSVSKTVTLLRFVTEASEITSSHIAVTHVQPPFPVDFVVSLQAYI
jgi:hypothetical protein